MQSIPVRGSRPYVVHVGQGVLAGLADEVRMRSRCAVVTDENVAALHGSRLGPLADAPTLTLEPGEAAKSMGGLERTLDFMVGADLDRRSCLVAFGGGVVGDLAGLAASLYMRGIPVLHAPTTLLAQVDSSVGGKTAINLRAGKNLAGTFHQPAAVYSDPLVLGSLPEDDFRSGLGEAVKTALLSGSEELGFLEENAPALLARDPETLGPLVGRCVRTKASVVEQDERESGVRAKLNLGHTFGHAIEHAAGYGRVPHGIAVGVGLGMALDASRSLGLLEDPDLPERVQRLMANLGLETTLRQLTTTRGVAFAPEAVQAGLRHDKKGAAGVPRLVLPRAAGRVDCDIEAPAAFWERWLAELP